MKALLEPQVRVDYAHGCDYAARPDKVRPIPGVWYSGEYFANPELAGVPIAKRTERPLNFDFCKCPSSRAVLPPGVPETGMSARWSRRTAHNARWRVRIGREGQGRVSPYAWR